MAAGTSWYLVISLPTPFAKTGYAVAVALDHGTDASKCAGEEIIVYSKTALSFCTQVFNRNSGNTMEKSTGLGWVAFGF